jgi:hypothetical protein
MDYSECRAACKRFGRDWSGIQRFRCKSCRKIYSEERKHPLGAMTVRMEKAVLAAPLLVEGASLRGTERIAGLHRDPIMRLLIAGRSPAGGRTGSPWGGMAAAARLGWGVRGRSIPGPLGISDRSIINY